MNEKRDLTVHSLLSTIVELVLSGRLILSCTEIENGLQQDKYTYSAFMSTHTGVSIILFTKPVRGRTNEIKNFVLERTVINVRHIVSGYHAWNTVYDSYNQISGTHTETEDVVQKLSNFLIEKYVVSAAEARWVLIDLIDTYAPDTTDADETE